MSKARPCSPSKTRNQRHPYWHTWVFPGSNPGSRKDKNLKHNAVLRVRLRHPSPLGGSLGRRVGYGPVNQGNRREVASARLENKGAPPGRWGQGGTWYTYLDVSFCLFVLYFLTSVVRRCPSHYNLTYLPGYREAREIDQTMPTTPRLQCPHSIM